MSHLQYYNPPGVSEYQNKNFSYSQAVRIGDRIECSGQGGCLREVKDGKLEFPRDVDQEIDQAFENCRLALESAGGKGWSQVFRVNSYHVPLNNEALAAMVRNFRKWMPDHQPLWTTVGVPNLAVDDMRVEIEVWAHDPEGEPK